MEFQSEIQTLAQVEHLNLVKLYGYLQHEDERIVVVEYVPNGTLREHLDCKFHFYCLIVNCAPTLSSLLFVIRDVIQGVIQA